jgi:hypothetical protein
LGITKLDGTVRTRMGTFPSGFDGRYLYKLWELWVRYRLPRTVHEMRGGGLLRMHSEADPLLYQIFTSSPEVVSMAKPLGVEIWGIVGR